MSKRSQIFSGARWTASSTVLTAAMTVLQIPVLSRFLDAADFGIFASISAVAMLLATLAVSAFPDYIVVTDDDDGRIRSTLYWLCAGAASVLFLVYVALAPMLSDWLHDGTTTALFLVSAFHILFMGFTENFRASLRKRMIFKPVALATLVGPATGFALSLVLVLFIQDARVLVYSWLAASLLTAGMLLAAAIRHSVLPQRVFDKNVLRPFWQLGRWRTLTYVLNAFNQRFDVILITWILGPVSAGFYFVAWRIVMQPLQRIMPIITNLALPVFSDIKDDREKMHRGYRKASSLTALILSPIVFGIMVLFPVINELLLGEGWNEVSVLVQILSILVLSRIFTPLTGAIMLALKDFKWALRWLGLIFLLTSPAVLIVGQFRPTTTALAATIAIVQSVILLVMYSRFLKAFEVPDKRVNISDIIGPLALGGLMAGVLVLLQPALQAAISAMDFAAKWDGRMEAVLVAAALMAIGGGIYGAGAFLFLRRHVDILRDVVFK